MRRHGNTIYITTDGAFLRKDGANVVVTAEDTELGRVPMHKLEGIVCLGRITVSQPLLAACGDHGVTVTHLDGRGRFVARVEGPVSGNVLLRREQYRRMDDPDRGTPILCHVVTAKVHNQRAVVQRVRRDHGDKLDAEAASALDDAGAALDRVVHRLADTTAAETARGLEGEAARAYFGVFRHFLRVDGLTFPGRTRRPPTDPVNALLSFLYTVLTHDCRSAAEAAGLDPQAGFLHRPRPGRPSLALDLLEEFRPVVADRLALSLINRGQVTAGDFTTLDNGAVSLDDAARKTVIQAWQERKDTEIRHPFLDEKTTLGLAPALQAQLLARHLRGDLDGYPPFLWK